MKKFELKNSFGELPEVMLEAIEELYYENKIQNKKIVLFGVSVISFMMKKYIEKKGDRIYAVIDNNKKVIGQTIDGVSVLSPEELLKDFDKNFVILIISSHYDEMKQQISSMGYKEGENVFSVVNLKKIIEKNKNEVLNHKFNELSIEEIKEEEFNILKYIKKVCYENDLRYYLCGGTMLGAVRHKGFIPWDDDIDISMPYPDYIKLLEIVDREGRYEILNNFTNNSYRGIFSKIMSKEIKSSYLGLPKPSNWSLCIDIFPIYSIPDDKEEAERVLKKNKESKIILQKAFMYETYGDKFLEIRNNLANMWNDIGFEKTEKVIRTCVGAAGYFEEEIISYKDYESAVDMEFCGELFSVPVGYHNILTELFGDYMKLPPENKRISHHNYIYYRK